MLRTCKPHFFWKESIPAQVRAKINEHTMKVFFYKRGEQSDQLEILPSCSGVGPGFLKGRTFPRVQTNSLLTFEQPCKLQFVNIP